MERQQQLLFIIHMAVTKIYFGLYVQYSSLQQVVKILQALSFVTTKEVFRLQCKAVLYSGFILL